MNIAIDGPSGAGKSTVAKILSKTLGIVYLDTGAMYRAVGLKAYRAGISPTNAPAVGEMLPDTKIDIAYENGVQKVFLDGEDVSAEIRLHHISKYASDVSAIHAVRLAMVEQQRKIAAKTDSVLDGRDIGTFVLPNAEFKFYLTADVSERAKRRYLELTAKGEACVLSDIERDIAARDYNDTHRDFAPLRQADDAIVIDSTHISIDEVAGKMLSYIKCM
ncbi:MAG: (d)CMP kinase [Firmicutes bacterium]|nr:(d)CMP kinase [Bacillota bacterium]